MEKIKHWSHLRSDKKALIFTGKILFTIAALYFVGRKINLSDLQTLFFQLDYRWIVIAFLLLITSKVISALRCYLLLKAIGLNLSIYDNIRLYFIGMYYNTLLPGSVGGDAYKIYHLNRLKIQSLKKISVAILLDRISGIWAIGVLIILLCLIFNFQFPIPYFHQFLTLGLLLSVPAKFIGVRILSPLFTAPIWKVSGLSILVQSVQILSCLSILRSLDIVSDSVVYSLFFLISSITSIIPISIGGLGLREATFIFLNDLFHNIDLKSGIAMSLIFFILNLMSSLPGGFITWYPKTEGAIQKAQPKML